MFNFYFSIEMDDTPNKHLHAIYPCPNQERPDGFARSYKTQFSNFLKNKYHTSEPGITIKYLQRNTGIQKQLDYLIDRREYIFKDLPVLRRWACIDSKQDKYYRDYHTKLPVKDPGFIDTPILPLTNKTILRHTIDYYLKNITEYDENNIQDIYQDMIKSPLGYSFIACSKYVKEQTIYELCIRYFKTDKKINNNNIYDTDNKHSFYTESMYKSILDIFMESLITDEQKQTLSQTENKDILQYLYNHQYYNN